MKNIKNNSRLKETSFSSFNLRDAYIGSQAEYVAALRDEALFSNWGIKVLIKIPVTEFGDLLENNVDEYSNFVDTEWLDTTETVIPKFNEYRQNVSEEGMSADGTDGLYPLEILIPSKLHLPRNSRIILSEYNAREERIAREWVVLGTVQKQLSGSKTYTRIANCVPARQSLFDSSNPSIGTIWFDYNVDDYVSRNDIRAQGIIWFLRSGINMSKVSKVYQDAIQEQIPDYPSYDEQIFTLLYYDDRAKNIINGGSGFNVGDSFELLDNYDQPIEILTNINDDQSIVLSMTVLEVDENGSITKYKLNTNKGYTELGDRDEGLVVNIRDASIKLVYTTWTEDLYQETIETPVISKPKYINAYRMETVFTSKKITVSVLN